jgi:hypothetical protein
VEEDISQEEAERREVQYVLCFVVWLLALNCAELSLSLLYACGSLKVSGQ